MNEDNNRTSVPSANMEQDTGNAFLGEEKAPRFNTPVVIRVVSYRKLKHDPDGVSAKAVLDGLVREGVLHDDSTIYVKEITFESRKAKTAKEEKTVIIIEDSNI